MHLFILSALFVFMNAFQKPFTSWSGNTD